MPKFDIVTCGSATVDVFADTDSELVEIKTKHSDESLIAYPSGSKILIENLLFSIGGGGTNTAVGFSRMGLKTGYIGSLGNDENADAVISLLKKEKVKFLGTKTKHNTGYSIILDSIEHDRTILTHKGANDYLNYKKIDKDAFNTKWFYFSSMMNGSEKAQESLAKYAKKHSIKLAFNPSEYQVKQGYNKLKAILDATEVLIFNKEEAQYLAGFGEIPELIKRIHDMGIEIVCITDGKEYTFVSNGEECLKIKPPKVKIKETTGAGDGFSSGFVSEFIRSSDIKQALLVGVANSQSIIMNYGAKNILLTEKQAKKYIKEAKLLPKVKKVRV